MAAAVFLDRDGTIIEDAHYLGDPNLVKLLPHAVEGMKKMREKGYLLFVVSNQSGVGRGIITVAQFKAVHEKFCELMKKEGVDIAEFCFCFHLPSEGCPCRKPETGLLPKSFGGQSVDWRKSFTIGDKLSDAQLGEKMGGRGCLLVKNPEEKPVDSAAHYPHYRNLSEMAEALPPAPR